MARPRKEIDQVEFKKLCGLQCTLEDIAGFFDCSEDTIERWCARELKCGFAEAFKKFSVMGKISLRRNQFELSKKSAAMAIFLGKNMLGQTDRQEIVHGNAGQLADLIDGLKEPVYDLHAEAAGVDGAMENESSEAN